MCPLTHIYISSKVTGRIDPLLIFGSVLPDIVWVSKIIPKEFHDDPDKFYEFVKTSKKEMLPFAFGIKLHSNQKGADYYAHFYKGGYAYTKSEPILEEVTDLIGSKDSKTNLNKAHNFIEAALDLHLLKDNPELLDLYRTTISEIKIDEIAECLSGYLNIEQKKVLEELNSYIKIVGPESISSTEKFVAKFIRATTGREVSKETILSILKKAVKVTAGSYKDLMKEIISGMKKDFADLI